MRTRLPLAAALLATAAACSQSTEAKTPGPARSPTPDDRAGRERTEPAKRTTPPSAAADRARRTAHEENTIRVFRATAPATVYVTQKRMVRDLWSRRAHEVKSGTGSGFLWDDDGHVVTNFHVIADASSFTVTLHDGTALEAELVGGDPRKDIAVIDVDLESGPDTPALEPVVLPPEGTEVEVGQTAVAIGNPFGLDQSLTVGVVSALDRQVKGYGGVTIKNMIQTDASINPGNSGGPLLDSAGLLMGMNTMIYSEVGQSAGVGFAVPTSTLRRVVPQIIEYGKPRRVGLGVELVPDTVARRNGIRGVVIARVATGGPADAAGLRGLRRTRRGTLLGDVILAIDDDRVTSYDEYYTALDGRKSGEDVTVRVRRGDETREVTVELEVVN